MTGLTLPTTLIVLRALQDWFALHPYPPTLRELAEQAGFAHPSSIIRHLDHLEAWGLITRDHHRARTIQLTHQGKTYRPPDPHP